jgi:hypothetical protein
MKIGKEYVLAAIGGLFLLAYVLQSGVKPLNLNLASPYQFINPGYFKLYPFTGAIIFIRSLALFISPLWILSWFGPAHTTKAVTLLIISGLMQLYALQQVAGGGAPMVSLEWSLSFTVAGLALLLPTAIFFLKGMTGGISGAVQQKITQTSNPFDEDDED